MAKGLKNSWVKFAIRSKPNGSDWPGLGELYPLLGRINVCLVGWMRKKCKRLRTFKKALAAWERTTRRYPRFFALAMGPGALTVKLRGAR
ncbi:MAG TPA: hypothetical protein VM347_42355 [Nonomuraea sp.]|nr:hypothetical protein [Nonomuraea sp.]